MTADLATRDIVPSEESELQNPIVEHHALTARRTISPFGRLGYYLTRTTCLERDGFVPGALPRVHLVTPAIVERTVARYGVRRILTDRERAAFDAFPVERRRVDWLAGRVAAKRAVRRAFRDHGEPPPTFRAIDVWNDPTGAPRFSVRNGSQLAAPLCLSIAHTHGAGLAAVTDPSTTGTVGVDIEPTVPVSMRLVSRVLSPAERSRVSSNAVAPSALALWTAKEAAMKAASRFGSALLDIELSWNGRRCVGARLMGAALDSHSIVVRHRSVGPYTIALALCR
jgi:phosphopantetheinyl transferase (holo-ACP synthase)